MSENGVKTKVNEGNGFSVREKQDVFEVSEENFAHYLDNLENIFTSKEFKKVLWDTRKINLAEKIGDGTFGTVYACKVGSEGECESVCLKIVSVRKFFKVAEFGEAEEYFDINNEPETDEQRKQKNIIDEISRHESLIYDILVFDEDNEQRDFVEPFMVEVRAQDKIVDYLICVNMPMFTKIGDKMEVFKEETVLGMISDILSVLVKVHANSITNQTSIRHRDIKPDNIMYYDKEDKYVLIDWGASIDVNRNGKVVSHTIEAGTPYYTDPIRRDGVVESKDYNRDTDLYPLGVIMAYFAHENGYFSGNSIEKFRDDVAPAFIADRETKETKHKIISADVYDKLDNVSEEYREIVRKSMNHGEEGYKNAGEMLEDVDKLIKKAEPGDAKEHTEPDEVNKTKEETAEKPKATAKNAKIVILLTDAIVLLGMSLYTYLLSGLEGISLKYGDLGWFVCILFGLLTSLVVACDIFSKNKNEQESSPFVEVKLKTIGMGVLLFAVLSLITRYWFLGGLKVGSALDVNYVQYGFVVLAMWVVSKIKTSNIMSEFLLKSVVGGAICGLCVGIGVISYIYDAGALSHFASGAGRFLFLLAGCGVLCAIAFYLISFTIRIRRKKD